MERGSGGVWPVEGGSGDLVGGGRVQRDLTCVYMYKYIWIMPWYY